MSTATDWSDALAELVSVHERLNRLLATPNPPPQAELLIRRLSLLAGCTEPTVYALFFIADACNCGLGLVAAEHLGVDFFPRMGRLQNLVLKDPDLSRLKKFNEVSRRIPEPFRASRVETGGPRVRVPVGTLPCTRALRAPLSPESVASPAFTTQPLPIMSLAIKQEKRNNVELQANDNSESPGPIQAEEGLLVERLAQIHGYWEEEFQARTAQNCLSDLLLLSRHRMERRMSEAGSEETQLLKVGDALSRTGSGVLSFLGKFWPIQRSQDDAYRSWAMAYACGTLAGSESLSLLGRTLSELPPRSSGDAQLAGEALSLIRRPELSELADLWLEASHPVLRCVAIELHSRTGKFGPERAHRWLRDPNLGVIETTLNCLARCRELPSEVLDLVACWMAVPDPDIAWASSRCLLLHGDLRPHARLESSESFAKCLGPLALELLVLCGGEKDRTRISKTHTERRATPAHLDRVARCGLGASAPYLRNHLKNPMLADDAASALEVMLGPHPDPNQRMDSNSWSAWIQELKLEPGQRYRCGEPWAPTSLAQEIELGELSRRGLQLRLDEFRVRLGRQVSVDVNAWALHLDQALESALPELELPDRRVRSGSFGCVARR